MVDKFFQDRIVEMYQDGYTFDQIKEKLEKELGEAENHIIQENEAHKACKKKEAVYEDMRSTFNSHYKDGNLNLRDVANLATLVVAPSYPNWSLKDIACFVALAEFILKIGADSINRKVKVGSCLTQINMPNDFDIPSSFVGNILKSMSLI